MKVLPEQFVARTREAIGAEAAERLLDAIATCEPVVSIRANSHKGARPSADASKVAWEPTGAYLEARPLFAGDPSWHQGRYYVQDASSMAIGEVVRRLVKEFFGEGHALRYLDACAAPGGKSIAALEALPEGSFLVANEYDGQRANILAENLARYGSPNVAITRGDTRHLGKMGAVFDIIGADVPCSGEGMMRKDETAVAQWSPNLVEQCAELQKEILHNLWKALKPGGFLIYSTCTFNRQENEENVGMLIEDYGAESIDLGLDSYEGVIRSEVDGIHGYRFMPGHVRGEGLFISVLRKPGALTEKMKRPGKAPKENANARRFAEQYLKGATDYALTGTERIEARPIAHLSLCSILEKHPSALRIGLPIAELRGKELAPTHELALSMALRGDVASVELDLPQALAYLRRETPPLPEGCPKGYVAVTYGEYALGWMKNIGNRANNQLPEYLKLRLDPRNLPETPPEIPLDYE